MYANGLKSPKAEEGRETVSWLEGPGQPPEDQRRPRNRPGLLVPVGPWERAPSSEVSWLWPVQPGLGFVLEHRWDGDPKQLTRFSTRTPVLRQKGTSQFALPTAAMGERVLQAPPQPTWTPAPRDHAWGVAGVGPDAGHAVKERGWFHSGHRHRGTTWPVSGLPVGFLVRKQVSLEHGSVRCPEAGEIPHSTPCLFRGFWSSNLPRGWRGSSGALRRRCRCCSSADPSAPAASGSLWKCVF